MNKFKLFEEVSNLIYPENMYCICCGDLIPKSRVHGLCDDCIDRLKWISKNPFQKRIDEFSFNYVLSLVEYDFNAQRIVHDLKFHEKNYIAKGIGRLMGELYASQIGDFGAIFVPVPMYPAKEKQRGYNQASLLAKYAAAAVGASYIPDALLKIKATDSMRTARAIGRMTALDNSIESNPERIDEIRGCDIVLVDDVITTGMTAETCSVALLSAGAKSVGILSFAAVNYKGNA